MTSLKNFDWDDDLLAATKRDGKPRARVYRPSQVSVVLGRGSKLELEVNVDAALEANVPLLRRRGGGCSVVLDPGNVIVSCTLPLPGLGGTTRAFRTISQWIIDALGKTGVPNVHQEGISDLALGMRKIGGACIFRSKDLLYYTTTLLFKPDLDLVERLLKHPPREPDYRAERKHRAFMGSLAGSLPRQNIGSFTQQIDQALAGTVEALFDANVSLDGKQTQKTHRQEVMV